MIAYINNLYKKLTDKKLKLVALTLRVNTLSRTSSEISRDIIVVIKSTISRRLKSAFKKVDIDINKVANSQVKVVKIGFIGDVNAIANSDATNINNVSQ